METYLIFFILSGIFFVLWLVLLFIQRQNESGAMVDEVEVSERVEDVDRKKESLENLEQKAEEVLEKAEQMIGDQDNTDFSSNNEENNEEGESINGGTETDEEISADEPEYTG